MQSELSFLLELLLNHKLPKGTQQALKERIQAVETAMALKPDLSYSDRPQYGNGVPLPIPASNPMKIKPLSPKIVQSASTQKVLDEMAAEAAAGTLPPQLVPIVQAQEQQSEETIPQVPPLEPVSVPVRAIAQTPATAAALMARQQAISIAVSGKEEKGRTSPRKF